MMTLPDLLMQRRDELKLSLGDISKVTKLSKSALSLIERGETNNPTLDTLDALARGYRLPLEVVVAHAIGRQLSRDDLAARLANLLSGLPEIEQREILTTIEALSDAKRQRLGL